MNSEGSEINGFGCIAILILAPFIGIIILGIRWFFDTFDARLNRRLEDYLENKNTGIDEE